MKLQNDFLTALLKEINLRRNYLGSEDVSTVYFGGGTPSLLSAGQLENIFDALGNVFNIAAGAEITFEANPDDISVPKLQCWKSLGINRLSIGIQSFLRSDLVWMNRAHDEQQAYTSIITSQDAGFDNISIDLIYGLPSLADSDWLTNLQTATSLAIPHLSCYALTVEPGTALDIMTKKKKSHPVSSDDQARQFLLMTDYLTPAGYEHYEISNFALPGKRSKHNSSYWSGAKYLGLGPSAHSFDGTSRQWNVSNNVAYIEAINEDNVPFEQEVLTGPQRFNEYIMTSLRTAEGTDISLTEKEFGKKSSEELVSNCKKFIEKGWMKKMSNRLVLTKEGKLFADGIASELFETA